MTQPEVALIDQQFYYRTRRGHSSPTNDRIANLKQMAIDGRFLQINENKRLASNVLS